ncbi:MAG: glycosyltransferase [Bacteroidota bacterium]|nr:glycosyltransferase [Bacteroidota bacterium]
MKRKKILVVAPAYPFRGGISMEEAYLYKIISSMGMDYKAISYTLLYPKIFFPGKTQYDDSKFIPFEHNDKIERIISSVNPFTWWKAYKKIKQEQPDIVIFRWWMFFFAPCIFTIAFLIRLRMKQTQVTIFTDNYISHENHWWEKYLVKFAFTRAHSFIAASEFVANQIKNDFPQKTICTTTLSIYDCYNLNRYDKPSAKQMLNINTKEVIIFFGLIRPYKGLMKLIEAFPLIKEKRKDITLLIVGECYGEVKEYEDRIRDLGIEKDVIFVNKFVANEDIEPYFVASDVVVLPYESASQSGIIMTAYAFRKPVVVTNVGGIKEQVLQNETGVVIDSNSKEDILQGVNTILDNRESIDYAKNIENFVDSFGKQKLKQFLSTSL